jgi:hypothetical protein
MPDLLERRKLDLEAQLESLPGELSHWEGLTGGRDFEKHHSQVLALGRQMRDLNDRVRKTWAESADFVAIQKAQRDCAAVHSLWNYYREKLLMRFDTQIGSYLRAADAYVWACYEPVLVDRRAKNPAQPFREPPLVAFDVEHSPWAQSRRADGSAGSERGGFDQATAAMPIAVLGIPWSSAQIPNLAALAHETGHVVESDFQLGEPLGASLAAATADSALRDGWSHYWRKEVFADLFACFAAGPSFVWTLADSIPDSPDTVRVKRRPSAVTGGSQWGKYPPATLRVLLNLAALRRLGYATEARAIDAYWKKAYPEHAMSDFEGDVERVVHAVYDTAALPAALNHAALAAEQARVHKTAVEQASDLPLGELYNPRTLVSVASSVRRAPPQGLDEAALWVRLRTHMVESRPPGVLARQRERTGAAAPVRLETDTLADLLFSTPDADDDS